MLGLVIGGGLLVAVIVASSTQSEANKSRLIADLNAQSNALVDDCLKSASNNPEPCQNLRVDVQVACDAANNQLNVCNDDRVERYYKIVQKQEVIEETTDLRCFSERLYTWYLDADATTYYDGYLYFEQTHMGYCDTSPNNQLFTYRMVDVNEVYHLVNQASYSGIYQEYHMLDDSVIKLGTPEIKTG